MTKSHGTTRSLYIATALAIFLLDRWTKFIVAQKISLFDSISVIPGFFKITHLRNTGAAFSLFADAPAAWRMATLVIFSIVALVIVLVLLVRNSRAFTWNGFSLALILGGALGNLWDRVLHGWVTDFLLVYYKRWEWPAFNVADSAICVGAVLLIAEMLFKREHAPAHDTQLAKE
ncbi:signal peptidase II [Candidatus Koribacter versatilis Ellin345]|uniref:Lipoprotein signal peptidase n=1 Tax=Koribacter versatilis (strain Ellin345) TaxID=204669 RepID=Q1IQI9_KORVE|nr:signal peptidase II [Candidatus Koribacter versatilis]ABF40861.1 signal peptidase II [Candidatus Koribacter versatilis Ellin345]